jgi:hypothetical protein
MFGIWCEVSGGVTGHPMSWLKVEGIVQVYDTLMEAEAIAADIQKRASRANSQHPNAKATFSYRAREMV